MSAVLESVGDFQVDLLLGETDDLQRLIQVSLLTTLNTGVLHNEVVSMLGQTTNSLCIVTEVTCLSISSHLHTQNAIFPAADYGHAHLHGIATLLVHQPMQSKFLELGQELAGELTIYWYMVWAPEACLYE
jgi:hypothetical protein